MKNVLIAASLIAVLTGCASTGPANPIDNSISTAMLNQNIVQVVHMRPDFTAMTAGKAAFPGGLIGGLLMVSSGNEIVAQNNVPDPAIAIGRQLAKELAVTRGANLVPSVITLESHDAAAIARAAQAQAPYTLAVETRLWNFSYFPTDWTHYKVSYVALARLIDNATGKVLAQASCKRSPDSNVGAPTYDELIGGAAAGLKNELTQATASCVATLKTDLLNL